MQEQEAVFYDQGGIRISKTLAKFRGSSYPVGGINLVFVAAPRRLLVSIVGIVFLVIAYQTYTSDKTTGSSLAFLVVGVAALLIALGRPYALVLRVASGDQRVTTSRSKRTLLEIKEAIEQAIVARG